MKNLLFGLTAVGFALGFSAFTNAQKPLTTVVHGVLDEDGTRYEITAAEAAPGHGCGVLSLPCTVSFNDAINTPYEESGSWYVDKDETPAHFTEEGSGGYTN